MADSILRLPGDFQPGKLHLIKGDTLLAWRKALLADRALPGPGLLENQTPQGRIFTAVPAPAGGSLSPFHAYPSGIAKCRIASGRLYTDISAPTEATIDNLGDELTLTATSKIWLELTLSSAYAVTAATFATGSAWPAAVAFTGSYPSEYQSAARVRIGEVHTGTLPAGRPGWNVAIAGSACHWEQLLHTHLFMALCAIDGKATQFPLAWAG